MKVTHYINTCLQSFEQQPAQTLGHFGNRDDLNQDWVQNIDKKLYIYTKAT